MFIEESKIDELIGEDGYLDLTTEILGIKNQKAKITFKSRDKIVLSSVEEVHRILKKFNCEIVFSKKSGDILQKDELILQATGDIKEIHHAWKVSQNLLEYACAVATKTKEFVTLAKSVNPNIEILTTRKTIPSTKKITIKAILQGGAYPHRLGLSESILIFSEHLKFIGGYNGLIEMLPTIKSRALEKNIVVEVKDVSFVVKLADAGVNIIQFDKLRAEDLSDICKKMKILYPDIKLLCAGGIDESNIIEYAQLNIDGLVLSSAYYSKPADIGVEITRIN